MKLTGRRHPALNGIAGSFPFPGNSRSSPFVDALIERHDCSESISFSDLALPARPRGQKLGAQATY